MRSDYRVLVSTGIGRLHLVQSAIWLHRAGVDVWLFQGWVPLYLGSVLRKVGERLGCRRLTASVNLRMPQELKGKLLGCAWPEILQVVLVRLERYAPNPYTFHWESARLAWQFFGWCFKWHVGSFDIVHIRSGAGQGGAIQRAKRLRKKVVVDQSIAHITDICTQEVSERRRFQKDQYVPDNYVPGLWRHILKDCEAADLVLVNSSYVKESFVRQGYPPEKFRVVYLGVRPDFMGLKTCYRDTFTPESPMKLLFTGGFGFRKGAAYLLEAMQSMKRLNLPVSLTVIGTYQEALPLLDHYAASELPVTFLGHVPQDDLKSHLAEADVFVFPSLAEGCASSGMEAMAAGLCVLATRESGLPIVDQDTGFHLELKSSESIVRKVEGLLASPLRIQQIGCAAAKTIRENFTWENYASEVKKVYEELIVS